MHAYREHPENGRLNFEFREADLSSKRSPTRVIYPSAKPAGSSSSTAQAVSTGRRWGSTLATGDRAAGAPDPNWRACRTETGTLADVSLYSELQTAQAANVVGEITAIAATTIRLPRANTIFAVSRQDRS